ncbi:hypothetical protein ACWD2L_05730 [Streptomyces sp. NPDC002754]
MTNPLAILTADENRYRVTMATALTAWLVTAVLVLLRALDVLNQHLSSIAILTVGVAIAASLSLGRMKLTKTITTVFQAGLASAVTLTTNALTDTCIVALDDRGIILSADHTDAIGWDEEELTGRELRALCQPKAGGVRKIEPGATITTPMTNQKGELFDAKISVVHLPTPGNGGRVIATIAPVVGGMR